MVAGEGIGWTKFAETWVKFTGGAEAGYTVNDGLETLAQTSQHYCGNKVAQKASILIMEDFYMQNRRT